MSRVEGRADQVSAPQSSLSELGDRRDRGIRGGEGLWLTLGAVCLTVVLWGRVIIGQRVLVAGDVLYGIPPWGAAAGAHPASNPIVSDTVVAFLAWQTVVHNAFWHGHLPLWNPYALTGSPLLANDQTGAFSPLLLLTLPFDPAHALSLVMIAKFWIAGLGTAFFLRQLGAGGKAAFLGGLAFATSSYIVVWLGYPNSTIAALLPLGFAGVEWFLRQGRPMALAVVALDIGLMFLAGHAPSEAQLIGALAVYTVVRWSSPRVHRWRSLAGLALAGVIGLMVGAVQVLPFVEALRLGVTFSLRQVEHAGEGHLHLSALLTWLLPNSHGNPAIDGLVGRLPNFSESAGFAGVGALVLAPLGAAWLWRRQRSAAVGLLGVVIIGAGVVYGPLSAIAGRMPVLAVSNNARLLALICFGVAVLGGLGLEVVASGRSAAHPKFGMALVLAGSVAILGLAGAWGLVYRLRGRVDSLLPPIHTNIGFWVAVSGLSVLAALLFTTAGLRGGVPRLATTGLVALAVVEAMIFAWPFNPVTSRAEVPPPSQAMAWLQTHAGSGNVAAAYPAMFPETATLYGLRDVSGYDLVVTPRVVDYWTAADPGFIFKDNITNLNRPGSAWLAAAGVTEILTPGDRPLPGTTLAFKGEGVAIGTVPDVRPFAYAARRTVLVSDPAGAMRALKPDPLGVVAIEGGCCGGDRGSAKITVLERDDDVVRLRIEAAAATTVVVGQSYYPGWQARLDGAPMTIHPANILFQAVEVPVGNHELILRYQPASFRIGAVLSLLGIVGMLGLVWLDRMSASRPRRKSTSVWR